ncbi:mitogen-activated protein kinase kinase kinase 4 isoform X2 [Plodia interpunctella]|nr:mitogen-activated protein kinase kinase kinase 4 isoform X2 [Plodia interpunctella]
MRHPRASSQLLADYGDGAEADLLGTTPPRTRIRDNIRRGNIMNNQNPGIQNYIKGSRKSMDEMSAEQAAIVERLKKARSLKVGRTRARDHKLDLSQRDSKADSLPSPGVQPAVPTLVESCSRFMSLTSKLKCRSEFHEEEVETRNHGEDEPPENRVNFHKTFCLLINMGNMEKGCRRTISREEQVWQNELKDLIWLELQAKIAGRTLAEQDEFLCAQRNIVPTLVRNIVDYRFVNSNPCKSSKRSKEDLAHRMEGKDLGDDEAFGCLSFNCEPCISAVGKAMKEVGTLLDSFYNAGSLYQSSRAMMADHPLVATQLFKNRIKAMCLWYNVALHIRMVVVTVRRMLRSIRLKMQRRGFQNRTSVESDTSRRSSESHRPCQVRFNVNGNPTDSSNSDSSSHSLHSDVIKEEEEKEEKGTERIDKEEKEGKEEKGDDEVDRVHSEPSGQITPEIVISDNHYGTSDTSTSNESGYASNYYDIESDDLCDMGGLSDLTQLRLLGKCAVSPYREYHYEMLKTQGVRRCMTFINKIRKHVLHKVHLTLQVPDESTTREANASLSPNVDGAAEVFDDTKEEDENGEEQPMHGELKRFGCWSEECLAMRLPSYRIHFLLLSSICMEAVHDYLTMRLEGRPERPSCLTVKQLIHELKEGLDIATEVRSDFVRNVGASAAARSPPSGRAEPRAAPAADLRTLVRTFDDTVDNVLNQYLSYLITMSETEQMSRACLHTEWQFTARLAKRVKCAEQRAPQAFTKIACNQLDRVMRQFENRFHSLKQLAQDLESEPEFTREAVYAMCREMQALYASEREGMLQAVQWARVLSARLARAPPPAFIDLRQEIFEKLMKIREFIVEHTDMVLEKSRFSEEELKGENNDGLIARVRDLLLQMFKLGFELHRELSRLSQTSTSEPTRPLRPSSLQIPHTPRPPPRRQRPETMMIHEAVSPIHKQLHRFALEPTSRSFFNCRRSLLNSPPRCLGRKLMRTESMVDEDGAALDDRLFETTDQPTQNSIELLLTGELPPSPCPAGAPCPGAPSSGAPGAPAPGSSAQWAGTVARAVIQFARRWMSFVVERCDTGRGLRPRWASQGLEFLMLACDPCNTKHLSEDEFKELEAQMDGCISHVVGSRRAPRLDRAPPSPRAPRKPKQQHCSLSGGTGVPAPPTPPTEPDPLLSFQGVEFTSHSKRVMDAIERVERSREETLIERKAVGHVLSAPVDSYEPKLRQLTFKWQRGLKIGAGTFGKVYTVVNTESGQLLAMKELSVGAGDRRALQRAANELRVLEGIVHPHLVRYYGCELHREEMLIFMELCVEGSLETLVATSGALPEPTVRRYTKQMLSAVTELHSRSIAHRDIKSGNIFLTNEGHCLKLGDFGCAVKIRANTTAPGELQGFVGTQAYMAPEVFMKSSGHGRAADIWSLGCVVTEMASGKRPFSEYDSNYQIMFVVGMGGRPEIPTTLSEEGQHFCRECLTHDAEQRPRASQLSLHHFLMVKSDEDCKCEPAFLI